jgi:hypothetical protein
VGGGGGGGGELSRAGAKLYDGEKAWSFINHSIQYSLVLGIPPPPLDCTNT